MNINSYNYSTDTLKVTSISVDPPAVASPSFGFIGSWIKVIVIVPDPASLVVKVNNVPNGFPSESKLAYSTPTFRSPPAE